MSEDSSGCHNRGRRGMLLASSGRGPRMLLNISECTGMFSHNEELPDQTALEAGIN